MTRWNPFRGTALSAGQLPGVEELFRSMGSNLLRRESDLVPDIRIEVSEDDKAYKVSAEIPGVDKKDIAVSIDGNEVSISAEVKRESTGDDKSRIYSERSFGKSFRSFTLPIHVDSSKSEARYENGVLHLTLPKKENGERRTISVN
jgi:HSP20 family protein